MTSGVTISGVPHGLVAQPVEPWRQPASAAVDRQAHGFAWRPLTNGIRHSVCQPVLPFTPNKDWNLITRTVIPFAYVDNVFPSSEGGFGDIVQSLWLSPSRPTEVGLTWGVGGLMRYYAEAPVGAPDWRFQLRVTFVFPR